jgi:hypothetical protein
MIYRKLLLDVEADVGDRRREVFFPREAGILHLDCILVMAVL